MDNLREYLIAEGLAPRTIHHYVSAAARAVRWFENQGWDLSQATAAQLSAYTNVLPRSWASRNLTRAALRHYWTWKGRTDPPVRALRVPPKPHMVCKALDEDDTRILAKLAREHGGAAGLAVALGLYLALRREEIAALRWDSFAGEWVTIVGKGDRSRTIPQHPVVAGLLAEHPRRDETWVFPGRGRAYVSPATVWQWTRDLADAGGVGLVPPHVLRHSCLATANDRTKDLRSTQDYAGHSRPETTAGYTRSTKARLQAITAALDY